MDINREENIVDNEKNYKSPSSHIESPLKGLSTIPSPPKVSMGTLHLLCFTLGMFVMQLGWVLSGNNQTMSVIKAQLGYANDPILGGNGDLGTSLITSSSVFGLCVGSIFASNFVKDGRRKSLLRFGFLAIIGTAISLVPNFYLITAGRLIHGISTGVFLTAAPRFIDETVPLHLISKFGPYTNIYGNVGVICVLLLGLGLPDTAKLSDEEA